jgi:serine phosphatase RsbU (regulator of sigma subunit)
MEHRAKIFARWVLVIHLLLLAGVITMVFFASREVYEKARAQALTAAANNQSLLAEQTADGIETFYRSIRNDLDLIHHADDEENTTAAAAATQPIVPLPAPFRGLSEVSAAGRNDRPLGNLFGLLLWRQLEGRASLLFSVDADRLEGRELRPPPPPPAPPPSTLPSLVHTQSAQPAREPRNAPPAVRAIGPVGSIAEARKVTQKMAEWLKAVERPSVSSFQEFPGLGDGNVVCVPAPAARPNDRARQLLVAFVPIETIRKEFLEKLNPKDSSTSATLTDEAMVTMVSSDSQLVGIDARKAEDPKLRELVERAASSSKAETTFIEHDYQFGSTVRHPRMMTMVPVNVLGKRWFLLISSRLSAVDDVVNRLFSRALYWAIFVVIAMTALLVSTAVWLIRGRARLERVRHQLLTKELTQAREIQKAWLPSNKLRNERIDVSAVNHPASHISGDFYNWFELPDGRLVVTIGDVTGHGMSAAFLMATTQLLVRTTMMRLGGDPGLCLEEVNRQLCTQIFIGQFVTMLIVVVDLEQGELQVATAGHYPPLVSSADGSEVRPLEMEPQIVLGVDATAEYPTEVFALPAGGSLLLYTDGVLDVEDPAGQRFGKQGIRDALAGQRGSAQDLIDTLLSRIDTFRGRIDLPDDLTLVAIRLAATPIAVARASRL